MLRLLLTVSCLAVATVAWLNDFDQPVHFECPANTFLSHVNSMHNNDKEDRVWDLGCAAVPLEEAITQNCAWTNYVNQYDQPVTYQCPNEGFITGMASVHDNGHEDRRFQFRCCDVAGTLLHSCYFTDWENDWDGILDFIVPSGKILRGVDSFHRNDKEDRRFKFEICDIHRYP
ncbi:dermatopontin-like [Babylonia areolata]|uniref:dermatopontin-like n=1 Tax=Babylonia areolata TaxID=304850 RepID=UPI003FD1B4ED